MINNKIKLRVSSSIAPFREKAEKIWKLEPRQVGDYTSDICFFGLYSLSDWLIFMRCRGKRYALWAGSDISLLKKNWAFSDGGGIEKSKRWSWIKWYKILRMFKAEHFVENEVEQKELAEMGIRSEVRPSFLEDIDNFPISFRPVGFGEKVRVFASTNKDRENEYGFGLIHKIAKILPDVEFHLYGANGENTKNIVYHGRVNPEQFNKEIKNYHCSVRTNEFDGASEIMIKSVLCGGYPITKIKYPMIDNFQTENELIKLLKKLKNKRQPNTKARDYWRDAVNNFPWIKK